MEHDHPMRRKNDGGIPVWAKRWIWIAGLVSGSYAAIACINPIYGLVYKLQYRDKVDQQIDAKLVPHCEGQKRHDAEILKRLDDTRDQLTCLREEMRVNNAEQKAMLKILLRKAD
jgi:hypothetical protein